MNFGFFFNLSTKHLSLYSHIVMYSWIELTCSLWMNTCTLFLKKNFRHTVGNSYSHQYLYKYVSFNSISYCHLYLFIHKNFSYVTCDQYKIKLTWLLFSNLSCRYQKGIHAEVFVRWLLERSNAYTYRCRHIQLALWTLILATILCVGYVKTTGKESLILKIGNMGPAPSVSFL